MTDRVSGVHRTTTTLGETVKWLNVAGETIPAYGVVQLNTNYAGGRSQAARPTSGDGLFFANGPVAVVAAKKGESLLWSKARLVLVDGAPTVGTEVGPVAGSFSMSSSGAGYRVFHQAVGGVAAVLQVGGGGGVITNVRFRIVSSDPTTFTGLAEVLAWDYGFTLTQVPALILGSVIEICDPRACFLNEPNVHLTGRQGTAVYRQGVGSDDICRAGYAPFPGVWEVDGLCCRLLSCDVVI